MICTMPEFKVRIAKLLRGVVVTKAAETEMKFDYIVCAHKAIHQDAVPADIEAAVDPARTTIVIIQNGVGNEEPFRESFPSTTIISCVVSSTPAMDVPVCMLLPCQPTDPSIL